MSRLLLPLVAVVAASSFLPLTARPDGDEKQPGFRLTLANGDATDVTSARLVALYVPAGTRPSPFVPAGTFTATWQGDLTFELPEELTFSAEGRGKLVVKLKEQVLLDLSGDDFAKSPGKKVEVPGEPTPLTVSYQAPANGDAFVRLSWKGETFVREPVAFTFARHDRTKEQKASAQVRQGRELTAHLHCVKCHAVEKAALPELAEDAPSLATIGGRAHEPWLAHWVQDPHALRPRATMPKLLAPSEKGPGPDARDLAAYLAALGAEAPKDEPPPADETVNKGARLFSHLGCVSCHLAPAKEEFKDEEHDRLPLRHVAAKWKPAALRAFLRKPTAHHAAIRMPDFGLSADEADQLAAFLLKASTRTLGDGPYEKGDAKRGKELLTTKGCLACHAATDDKKLSPPKAPALADLKKLDAGCLADAKPGGKVPAFALADGQRDALRAALTAGPAVFQHDAPIDLAERTLTHLRCYACHQRDGREDAWSRLRDEGDALLNEYPGDDAEKDPIGQPYPAVQLRPPLTWTGEKLRPEWLAAFLGGKVDYKPRPYLRARMPHFAGPMESVALGLALQHGRPPKSPPPPVDEKMADAGRTLSAKKNWGCIACHNVGKAVAAEAFEAPGINFAHVRDRLTRDYFDRWVYSPLRVEPGTKMPAVFQVGRKSLLDQFFDGDADKQVEALWQYLQKGDKIAFPPE